MILTLYTTRNEAIGKPRASGDDPNNFPSVNPNSL